MCLEKRSVVPKYAMFLSCSALGILAAYPDTMLLAQLPEAVIGGAIPPCEYTKAVLFAFNPLPVIALP